MTWATACDPGHRRGIKKGRGITPAYYYDDPERAQHAPEIAGLIVRRSARRRLSPRLLLGVGGAPITGDQ